MKIELKELHVVHEATATLETIDKERAKIDELRAEIDKQSAPTVDWHWYYLGGTSASEINAAFDKMEGAIRGVLSQYSEIAKSQNNNIQSLCEFIIKLAAAEVEIYKKVFVQAEIHEETLEDIQSLTQILHDCIDKGDFTENAVSQISDYLVNRAGILAHLEIVSDKHDKAIGELKTKTQGIPEIRKNVDDLSKAVQRAEDSVSAVKSKCETSINTFEEKVSDQLKKQNQEVADVVEAKKQDINGAISDFKTSVDSSINTFEKKVSDQLKKQNQEVADVVEAKKKELSDAISGFKSHVNTSIKTFTEKVSDQLKAQDEKLGRQIEIQNDLLVSQLDDIQKKVDQWKSSCESEVKKQFDELQKVSEETRKFISRAKVRRRWGVFAYLVLVSAFVYFVYFK